MGALSAPTADAPPSPRWLVALTLVAIAATALVATWPAPGVGSTEAAAALAGSSDHVSDGAAVWVGWRPLAGAWPLATPGAGHGLSALLWAALALLVFAAGRRLGLPVAGAAIAAVGIAAHPLGGAIAGDLAARGTLWALVGFAGALWMGLAAQPRWPHRLAAGLFMALGVLGHPMAALGAVALAAALTTRDGARAAAADRGLWLVSAVALAGIVVALAVGGAPIAQGPSGAIGALALVGRATRLALTGTPLTREPWELADGIALTDDAVFIGAFALLGGLAVAIRARRPGLRTAVVVALAALLVLAVPALTMASAQPLGAVAWVAIGLTWSVGALIPERWRYAGPLVAVVAISATLALPRPVDRFATEATATVHELHAAPQATALRRNLAERELAHARPRNALALLDDAQGPGLLVLRTRALLALNRWGEAQRLIRDAPAGDAALMRCALASARADVSAERECRAAVAAAPGDVPSRVALAEAVSALGRPAEAEVILRELVGETQAPEAWRALIAHFEGFGWVREAVAASEEWLAAQPADVAVRARLAELLLRKVRGDLLDNRFDEAATAARRLLEVDPRRAEVRYYLADALEGQGQRDAAERERARAREQGVAPPPPPDAAPGLPGGLPSGMPAGAPDRRGR